MTSSNDGGSGSSLLHVWCTAHSQQHLLPHLLYQHITNRFHHFRFCHTPEMTSSPWVAESAPETQACCHRAEVLSDPELDEDEEDAIDTEAGQVLDGGRR